MVSLPSTRARRVRVDLIGNHREPLRHTEMIDNTFLFILFLIFQLAASLFLTPLEVISTRLSIQRNSYSPYAVASQHESGMGAAGAVLPDGVGWAGMEEDVIGLRPEEEPYEG